MDVATAMTGVPMRLNENVERFVDFVLREREQMADDKVEKTV